MNWTWSIRSRDGGMNGLEFARATTAGGLERVLVHAAPARARVEVATESGKVLVRADADREGEYSPMTLLTVAADGQGLRREEVWPDEALYGLPVLLAGGEVGVLTAWRHAPDRSWWTWSVEFSNHRERPPDWEPPTGTSGNKPPPGEGLSPEVAGA